MKYLIAFFLTTMFAMPVLGENKSTEETEYKTVVDLSRKYQHVKSDISIIKGKSILLESNLKKNSLEIDSLHKKLDEINIQIKQTENSIAQIEGIEKEKETEQNKINEKNNFSLIIVSVISIVLLLTILLLIRYIRRMNQNFETKLEECNNNGISTSVKLNELIINHDSKLADLIKSLSDDKEGTKSLNQAFVLEIAEQITRMEVNLYRMDSAVKGHKQLTRAINNIKDSLKAKGYEVSELLGTRYVEGMKVNADFVEDENMPLGTQIITGIRKPQILFNGKLLQAAEITVSQNI